HVLGAAVQLERLLELKLVRDRLRAEPGGSVVRHLLVRRELRVRDINPVLEDLRDVVNLDTGAFLVYRVGTLNDLRLRRGRVVHRLPTEHLRSHPAHAVAGRKVLERRVRRGQVEQLPDEVGQIVGERPTGNSRRHALYLLHHQLPAGCCISASRCILSDIARPQSPSASALAISSSVVAGGASEVVTCRTCSNRVAASTCLDSVSVRATFGWNPSSLTAHCLICSGSASTFPASIANVSDFPSGASGSNPACRRTSRCLSGRSCSSSANAASYCCRSLAKFSSLSEG